MSTALSCTWASALLAGAIESDCAYFEMGAKVEQLAGAKLAWMPGLTRSPAAAVIHRVDPDVIAADGVAWISKAETAMADIGASLCRIYVASPHAGADEVLKSAGYQAEEELVFAGAQPDPGIDVLLRPVTSEADWDRKLQLHAGAEMPDGHTHDARDWVQLERAKCAAGMDAFLAEVNGEVVGAVGAIWCDAFVRTKNLVVAPERRRRGIARAMLGGIAKLGRQRGLSEQCLLAIRGQKGELLYRAVGMRMIGSQVEWSKPIPGRRQ